MLIATDSVGDTDDPVHSVQHEELVWKIVCSCSDHMFFADRESGNTRKTIVFIKLKISQQMKIINNLVFKTEKQYEI